MEGRTPFTHKKVHKQLFQQQRQESDDDVDMEDKSRATEPRHLEHRARQPTLNSAAFSTQVRPNSRPLELMDVDRLDERLNDFKERRASQVQPDMLDDALIFGGSPVNTQPGNMFYDSDKSKSQSRALSKSSSQTQLGRYDGNMGGDIPIAVTQKSSPHRVNDRSGYVRSASSYGSPMNFLNVNKAPFGKTPQGKAHSMSTELKDDEMVSQVDQINLTNYAQLYIGTVYTRFTYIGQSSCIIPKPGPKNRFRINVEQSRSHNPTRH